MINTYLKCEKMLKLYLPFICPLGLTEERVDAVPHQITQHTKEMTGTITAATG